VDNIRERWNKLDKRAQQEILDANRDINVDYDWWDYIYSDFVMDMQALGITVDTRTVRTASGKSYEEPDIVFSGFWSQGDGAGFAGSMYCKDLLPRMEKEDGMQEMYNRYKSDLDCFIRWNISFHRSNLMTFDYDYDLPDVDSDNALRRAAQEQIQTEFSEKMESFFEDLSEEIQGHADDLYRKLGKEYDFLTEDETVLETLISNDMLEEKLTEYEDGEESDESESTGSADCSPHNAAA